MEIIKRVAKKSFVVIIPLAVLSFLVNWKVERLKFIGLFGNPDFMTISIVIGGIIGLANLKGLIWGIESLLGTYKANTKLVFLSLFRLFILFAVIIILVVLRVINLLGLLIGMTAVFMILIIEAVNMAKEEGKE